MLSGMTRADAITHNVRTITDHGVDDALLDKLVDARALPAVDDGLIDGEYPEAFNVAWERGRAALADDDVPDDLIEGVDQWGNEVREEGVDRCWCGSKYWENDRCVDCGGTEVETDEEAK